MKHKITTITMGILLLSCISAINLTAGESKSIELSEEYVYYEMTGNTTEVEFNLTKNGTIVTIEIDRYMNKGSFEITFYDEKGEEIQVSGSQQKGGGSSYTKKEVVVEEVKNETIIPPLILEDKEEETNETIIAPQIESDDGWKILLWVIIGALISGFLLFFLLSYFLRRKKNEIKNTEIIQDDVLEKPQSRRFYKE